ncbi:membrane protein insertion efficiency factor YidD [Polynucleobacter paneuropaeus]|nr:membrane protein insertion efficiency factor YidD [Polynucleobacter paneuropaeus]
MRPLNALAIKLLRLYQISLSPYFGAQCKYFPSCSQYACDCFKHYGFFKSARLSVWRILRCNPWSRGGHDPAVKQISHSLSEANGL